MIIDCKSIFAGVDTELPIRYTMQLGEREALSDDTQNVSAEVVGQIVNTADVVTCRFTVSFTLSLCCDRCAEQFERDFSFSYENILVQSVNRESSDEYVIIPDAQLDVDELVEDCILLSLPSKNLCRPDCKGLCPECGQNRNVKTCSCLEKRVDPRLEALRQLLE